MKTQQEDGRLQAKEGGLRRNQLCLYLDHGFLVSRLEENKFLLFKPSGLWHFVTSALGNQYTGIFYYRPILQPKKQRL